jgi:hypothetical protein
MIGFLYAPTLSERLMFKIKTNAKGFIVLDKCLAQLVEDSKDEFSDGPVTEDKD